MSKTTVRPSSCPITRDAFVEHASMIQVTIAGHSFYADPKTFSTGSMGWNVNAKLPMEVGGKLVMCQVGLNLTVIGSKDAQ